ncbi:MAG: MGMT family protein [Alkalispirochaeta sp.]
MKATSRRLWRKFVVPAAPSQPADSLSRRIAHLIRAIPYGSVATYGQIAALAGNPRAARTPLGRGSVRGCRRASRPEPTPLERDLIHPPRSSAVSYGAATVAYSVES